MAIVGSSLRPAGAIASKEFLAVAFVIIVALVALVRMWLALRGHSIRHPDEIFQTLEQSHRMVFGYGIVPWEFREGIRWLGTPLLLTPPLWLAKVLDLGSDFYIPVTRALLAAFALYPVPFFFVLVSRSSGPNVALVACVLPLLWVEHFDFAGSTLSDAIAAPLMSMSAIGSLLWAGGGSKRAIATLAFLIVLTFCMRFHLAPALLVVSLSAAWRMSPPNRTMFLIALAAWASAFGLLDLLLGQTPFQHVYLNVYRNIFDGVAAGFGEQDWTYYMTSIWEQWQWGLFVPVVAIVFRWRSTWLLFISAVVIVVAFSLIAHKEYRFYYPATMLFTFAAGWAIAESAFVLVRKLRSSASSGATVLGVAALLATILPAQGRYLEVLEQEEDSRIAAQMFVGRAPDACGLGFDIGLVVTGTAGLVHVNKRIGFDIVDAQSADASSLSRFNYLLLNTSEGDAPREYRLVECWDDLCLYRRGGACSASTLAEGPGP